MTLRKTKLSLEIIRLLRENACPPYEGSWTPPGKGSLAYNLSNLDSIEASPQGVAKAIKRMAEEGIIAIQMGLDGRHPLSLKLLEVPEGWEKGTRPATASLLPPDPIIPPDLVISPNGIQTLPLPEAPPAPENPTTPHERLAAAVGLILEVLGEPVISQDMILADRVSTLLEENQQLRRKLEITEDQVQALTHQNRGLIALKRQLEENIKKLSGNGKVDDRAYRNLDRFIREVPNAKR